MLDDALLFFFVSRLVVIAQGINLRLDDNLFAWGLPRIDGERGAMGRQYGSRVSHIRSVNSVANHEHDQST